jgi:arginine:ornithine antiporter/lysine permease
VGNTTYWVLIMSTLGAVLPVLGEGDTFVAVLVSSIGVWTFFLLVRRGVREAALINRVVTVAKLVPILLFIVLMLFYLDPQVFADNITTGGSSLFTQVRATMLVTVFVFLGVEGASVYSRHARRREDIGRATLLGFLSVLAIFASVTIVSYGILPAAQIASLRQPSMAGIMEAAVGTWGSVFVSVGLIVSVGGAYLAWSLMAAEVLFAAARDDDMPRFLKRTNAADVPQRALLMSSVLVQIMLIVVSFSENAFDFAVDLTSSLSLIPYLLAAGYALKLALTRATGGLVVGALATAYTVFLLYAAGPTFLLLSFLIYAPATVLFVMARREQGKPLFRPPELVILAVSLLGALTALTLLLTHAIRPLTLHSGPPRRSWTYRR